MVTRKLPSAIASNLQPVKKTHGARTSQKRFAHRAVKVSHRMHVRPLSLLVILRRRTQRALTSTRTRPRPGILVKTKAPRPRRQTTRPRPQVTLRRVTPRRTTAARPIEARPAMRRRTKTDVQSEALTRHEDDL